MIAEFSPFIVYLFLLFYLSWRARRSGSDEEEFLLSGRSLSLPAFVATLVTTWYGGILGVGEFVHSYGISTWFVFGLPYYFFALLFAFVLAPKIRLANNYSIPEMFYRTYGKPAGVLGSFFVLLITSPAPYILMLAVLIMHIFKISFAISIIGGTIFSMIYVMWGGFRSVVQTDKLQFILMFSGFLVIVIILITQYASPAEMLGSLPAEYKNPTGGLSWQELLVWFLIASWTFIDPGFHQRCAAASSSGTARKGIMLSVLFWFIFDSLTLLAGLYARVLLPDAEPMLAYPLLADKVLPGFLKGLFFTGLLATIMSTVDSFSFLSAMTFGRDLLQPALKKKTNRDSKYLVRWGLLITAVISILFILWIPSVIELWYHLGSLFIPPLLLPLLGTYFAFIRLPAGITLISMISSFVSSAGSYLWGIVNAVDGLPVYPGHLEPFIPGMLVSLFIYVFWKIRKSLRNYS